MNRLIALTVASILIISPGVLAGGTSFSPIFGARSLSLNGLYIAGSDGLSSSWTNPAGFVFLTGKAIGITGLDRMEQQQFDSPSGGLYRSYRNDNISLSGGVYWNLNPGLIVALGYNRLVNYSVNWPYVYYRRQDTLSAINAFDFYNRIQVDAISPSVGFLIGNLAIGLTLNAYNVSQSSAFPINNSRWTRGIGLAAYQFTYDQSAWTFGVNLGVIADLSEKLRIGAMVHSGFKASLKGTAKSSLFADLDSSASSTNLNSDFKYPWVLGLGIIYKLSNSLMLNVDASYNLWNSAQNNFAYNFSNTIWQQSLSTTDSLTGFKGSNFQVETRNSLDAGFGLEYSQDAYSYRLGYRYSQSPISSTTSYSLLFPVVDQHWITLGFGYKEESYSVDAAIAFVIGVSKDVERIGLPDLSGNYRTDNFIPTITIHFNL